METLAVVKNSKHAGKLNVQKRATNPVKSDGYFKILVPTILLTGVVGVGVIFGIRFMNKKHEVVRQRKEQEEEPEQEERLSSVKQRMRSRGNNK